MSKKKTSDRLTLREKALDLELLRDALELAEGTVFLFAVCPQGAWRRQLKQILEDELRAQGRDVVRVSFSPKQPVFADQLGQQCHIPRKAARTRSAPAAAVNKCASSPVVFVELDGFDQAGLDFSYLPPDNPERQKVEEAQRALRALNLQRESLARLGVPIVFWLDRTTLAQVARHAADLFAARSGIFYLEPPEDRVGRTLATVETVRLLERIGRTALPPEELRRRATLYEARLKRAETTKSPHWPGIAGLARELAEIYHDIGDDQRALAHLNQAVEIYRHLAQDRPEEFLPILAASLNDLGKTLFYLGRREEALAATQEAVELYRQLAARNPEAFLPDLARSLNNLGAMLSDVGRREEALAATEHAVDLYRQLAAQTPQAFLPYLAASLTNLGAMLSALGRRKEALAATEEAVAHYRQLAQANPQAFLPYLATSLNNLGNALSALGRREEALAATQEAVAHYRQLAAQNPQAFLPYLAGSLANLGARLSEVGRREEALGATEEAVAHYRQLAQANPQAFLPNLARSLRAHGSALLGLGKAREAREAFAEGLRAILPFVQALPAAFGGLAAALLRDYLRACEEAGEAPDGDLLRAIEKALQKLSK